MSIITYVRPIKCKDCANLKYFYKGKRKFHKCIVFNENRCLNDNAKFDCSDKRLFIMNENYYPGKL